MQHELKISQNWGKLFFCGTKVSCKHPSVGFLSRSTSAGSWPATPPLLLSVGQAANCESTRLLGRQKEAPSK